MGADTENKNEVSGRLDDDLPVIYVGELYQALVRGRVIILVCVILSMAISVFYAMSQVDIYKSHAVLSPAQDGNAGSGVLSKLGGLASLAGLGGLGSPANRTKEALEVLTSWQFISMFVEKYDLAPEVLAAENWSPGSGGLIYDLSKFDPGKRQWLVDETNGETFEPSSWQIYKKFNRNFLHVTESKSTGFVELSIRYYSPQRAKEWVELLTQELNSHFRERDKAKALANIAFLQKQIAETDISSMHSVLYELIEEQTKSLMLASNSPNYIFDVISAPMIPEEKHAPRRSSIVMAGVILGFAFGFLVACFRHFTKK